VIVADTDVLIDALRGRDPAASRVAWDLERGALATTTITAFELLSGACSSGARDAIGRLLAAMEVYPFDEAAARGAADARRSLDEVGTPIGMADYVIAGICLSRSADLLTRNRGHFERVPGLSIAQLAEGE
jgi:predicted nucleic acid-binding protein